MQTGKLDRRITIKTKALGSKNGYGHEAITWTELTPVWANVQFVRDSEKYSNGEVNSSITHRFQIRYSDAVKDVDASSLIVFDGVEYQIIGARKELGRREGLEFSAVARQDG